MDLNQIKEASQNIPVDNEDDLDLLLHNDTTDKCNIIIENNAVNINKEELGDDDYIIDL